MSRGPIQLLLPAVLLMAGACGGGNATANASNEASGANAPGPPKQAPAAVSAAPAPASAGGFTSGFMTGKWSALNENCANTLEFRKDGTVTTPIGEAKWTVSGDKLSIVYPDGSEPTVSTVRVLEPGRIEITHASGTKETEKRC